MARFDLHRLADGFRRMAGDAVGELARRSYGGDPIAEDGSDQVFAAFGPTVPSTEELSRVVANPDINRPGMDLTRKLDLVGQLDRIASPTLVCVGDRDPITPVSASQEIVDALAPGVGRLEVLEGAGHFSWLDQPAAYWSVISSFVASITSADPVDAMVPRPAG